MSEAADVLNIEIFTATVRELLGVEDGTKKQCGDGLDKVENVLQQTHDESDTSEAMLEAARAVEAMKAAQLAAAGVRMAQALAQEAAAAASGNPAAMASAAAEVAEAASQLQQAQEEYEKAKEHREKMEHRFELAERCVNIAEEMTETLRLRFNYSSAKIYERVGEGSGRLQSAYNDLTGYLSRVSSVTLKEISDFNRWKPEEKKPVNPGTVHDRLNVSGGVADAVLEYLYTTDLQFRSSVDRLCGELKTSGNESGVELKIKKNVVGRLCEELVIRTFAPLGERVKTQGVYYLEDGTFTKADLIVYGLKEPLILGRGEGMSAPVGSNLGIEVKSGKKEYIYSQLEHMEKQAKGHSECELSCTICSRDIKDLPEEKEKELRERLREAGSPILGMLPKKSELDEMCIKFIKEKAKG